MDSQTGRERCRGAADLTYKKSEGSLERLQCGFSLCKRKARASNMFSFVAGLFTAAVLVCAIPSAWAQIQFLQPNTSSVWIVGHNATVSW